MSNENNAAKQPRILVVEDDFDLREALADTLKINAMQVDAAEHAERAMALLEARHDYDLVVSDVNLGKMSGHDLLQVIRRDYSHIPVLLITAYASISESVHAMRLGAVDYLVKPFEHDVFVEVVRKYVMVESHKSDEPVAEASSSKQLLQLAQRVALSDSTVLLMGESGTGKEVLAKYIHDHSPRAEQPFVAVNCAAIPENMLEAMLFGHEKGAYTGAYNSAPGKFEQANGGTLLLDEISEMDLGLQAKLLRVLQEREVERLGGRKSIQLDVRVIATSNRDMRKAVTEGKFREDLYFRLSVLPLQWAPLRDRAEDILPLAKRLLDRHAKKQHRAGVSLSEDAKRALLSYPWPGNVRELDNVMQRSLILQPGETVGVVDLGLQFGSNFSEKPSLMDVPDIQDGELYFRRASGDGMTMASTAPLPEDPIDAKPLGSDMQRHEFEIIVKTLRQENGSKKNTAEKLGISPRTLRYKIARLKSEGFDIA